MQEYNHLRKRTPTSATAQAKPAQFAGSAGYLQDNRPQSVQQQQVFQLRSSANSGTVLQLARTPKRVGKTISGHGKLRRNARKNIMKFKVPKGQSVTRPAPPGATLGNLSMLLNEKKGLPRKDLLKKMKISTTKDIWTNRKVIRLIRNNTKIPKTQGQEDSLDKLLKGQALTGGEKGSLTRLESKSEFEQWIDKYVKKETFKTFNEGEEMEDMVLDEFENKLKSTSPHSENEYATNNTVLSQYVKSNSGVNNFMVNACSWDGNSPYTGFQIDQK